MELSGRWRVAEATAELRRAFTRPDLDDRSWAEADVPGHWRHVAGLETSDGPVLYRHRFEASPAGPSSQPRAFLVFDGIFYQGDVWLDGEYLGDTEGYFFPHEFEVTAALAERPEHLLAVEVGCARPSDLKGKRNLTGVFQHWDCIDPDWNPGGVWAGVHIRRTGPVRIGSLKVLCPEATGERAVLDVEVELDSPAPGPVALRTTVTREHGDLAAERHDEQVLSAGTNVVRWRMFVPRPDLWWPRALGDQPLYELAVEVATGGGLSDRRQVTTGLRQVRLRNFVATVNGERLFLKGANYGPARRDLAAATAADLAGDVRLAADAGLDLLRVHAHISKPDLYDAADRQGMLIWQDLPLQWGYARVRRQAVEQARQATRLLGHHPSVALWCGHNEPMALDIPPGGGISAGAVARVAAAQILPTANKTVLDRSIRRALERADRSRPVIAHSGVVPHPAWGTDSHLYFGWYHGDERDLPALLSKVPVVGRFVSEFGAQAVPDSADFMDPDAWPDLDWDRLEKHHSLQKAIFDSRVPPGAHPTFEAWRRATQAYQAELLRHHIEALRRLKYRPTGGFCFFMLADAQPAVTWSVLDHERRPKAGYRAVAAACAPVIITCERPAVAYRPGQRVSLAVHAVSDLRTPIGDAVVEATVTWPGGSRSWRFAGDLGADSCALVGRLAFDVPEGAGAGPMTVSLSMSWSHGRAVNSYASTVQQPG